MITILDQGGGYCSPCNTIWKSVDKLPSLGEASRNHAYVLPDNTVWVLNHDGTEFITSGSGSDNQTIDLSSKQDKLTAGENIAIKDNVISADLSSKQDKLTAGENIAIKDNVISADLSSKQDKLTAGEGIYIDDKNVISSMTPRTIQRYVVSDGQYEFHGSNCPVCVITIETLDVYDLQDLENYVVTIDINTIFYVPKDKDNPAEETFTVFVPDETRGYLNGIINDYDQIVVGEIPVEYDGKRFTFRNLTKDTQNRAFSATYYGKIVLALP